MKTIRNVKIDSVNEALFPKATWAKFLPRYSAAFLARTTTANLTDGLCAFPLELTIMDAQSQPGQSVIVYDRAPTPLPYNSAFKVRALGAALSSGCYFDVVLGDEAWQELPSHGGSRERAGVPWFWKPYELLSTVAGSATLLEFNPRRIEAVVQVKALNAVRIGNAAGTLSPVDANDCLELATGEKIVLSGPGPLYFSATGVDHVAGLGVRVSQLFEPNF